MMRQVIRLLSSRADLKIKLMNFVDLKPGSSVEGDDINSFRSENKGSKFVYLMAGVHGDEVEGVYVLDEIIKWLKENDEYELPTIVIPILNVDGYRAGTRVNAHGVDLNRNLPAASWSDEAREPKYFPGEKPLSEPENQYLDKLMAKYPPGIIITMHSWKPMINYNGNCRDVADILFKHNGYEVCDDIAGHPTPGSLGDYGPEKYGAPVLTFECPLIAEGKTLKEIWEENEAGFKELLLSDTLKSYT